MAQCISVRVSRGGPLVGLLWDLCKSHLHCSVPALGLSPGPENESGMSLGSVG